MRDERVTLTTSDGPMDAYVARPDGVARAPGVVVVQEAFGVNAHIRDVCARLAGEGFVAVAPELFHRSGRGVELAYGDLAPVMPHFSRLTNATIETDLGAAFDWLDGDAGVDGPGASIVGFCMGGFASFLGACRLGARVRRAVAFYGGGILRARPNIGLSPLIDEAERMVAPLLLLFGGADAGIPQADIDAIDARLTALEKRHETVVYPGAGHGFFCDLRPSYHAEAAADAWPRTLAWLRGA